MNPVSGFSRAFLALVAVWGMAAGLRADTPTPSPTFSDSPTPSMTPTPGSGSYAYTIVNNLLQPETTPFVIPGDAGYTLYVTYTAGTQFPNGGVVAFQFPADFYYPAPGLTPTYQVPEGEQYEVNTITAFPQGVSITVNGLNPGDPLILEYGFGYSPAGFSVVSWTTQTQESVLVSSNPLPDQTPGSGLVPTALPILVFTASATPTVTQTFTISPTFTVSPTPTQTPNWTATDTPTYTASPTVTPFGAEPSPAQGFYSYPNPFDMRSYPWATIRFQPTNENVQITIFSLLGNPVRYSHPVTINAALGYAQWDGTDDYGRRVPGGLYFVRLKTPSKTIVHKMTVLD